MTHFLKWRQNTIEKQNQKLFLIEKCEQNWNQNALNDKNWKKGKTVELRRKGVERQHSNEWKVGEKGTGNQENEGNKMIGSKRKRKWCGVRSGGPQNKAVFWI